MPISCFSEYADLDLLKLSQSESAAAGKAFEILYNRYRPALIDAAEKKLRSVHRAEDLVQDLFLSLFNRRHSLEITESFAAYIYTALRFRVYNEMRAAQIREKYMHWLLSATDQQVEICSTLDARFLNRQISRAVEQLPHKCRTAFVLSREQSLTYPTIAAQLSISVSTVEKHIVKALKRVRQCV